MNPEAFDHFTFFPFLMVPDSTPSATQSQEELYRTPFINALTELADTWNARLVIKPFHLSNYGRNPAK
jgi:hypothetical protein